MLIKWIKSALLPACSLTLSTRHFRRYGAKREGLAIKKVPSECFHEQIYTTFFNDAVGGHILTCGAPTNCNVVNNFPHGNSIWPNSRQVVARDPGDLRARCAPSWCAKTSRSFTHAGAEAGSRVGRQQRHIASR
jgi:hypothetical protein